MLSVCLVLCLIAAVQGHANSVVFMIPDGTSPNVFTMARTVLDPSLRNNLNIDQHLVGTVKTYSATSLITDSAASATACTYITCPLLL